MGFASCKACGASCNRLFVQRCPNKIESEPPIPCADAKKNHGLSRLARTLPTRVGDYTDNFHHKARLFIRINLPSGDSPGNEARASVSLITATRGRSSVSVRSKSRPARIGISRS